MNREGRAKREEWKSCEVNGSRLGKKNEEELFQSQRHRKRAREREREEERESRGRVKGGERERCG